MVYGQQYMICNKCGNTGILNTALGKHFYYCKTCKIEILLEEQIGQIEQPLTQEEIDELFKFSNAMLFTHIPINQLLKDT